jgi:hypothetical protein
MVHYITVGHDCSPAAALRNLALREHALPFDWVVSSIDRLQACFQDQFRQYHTQLRLNSNRSRMIDAYGFEFPHDYPLQAIDDRTDLVGEGVFGEEHGHCIIDGWSMYYDTVLEKYKRRIERFQTIMKDPTPLIVLCRYNRNDIFRLKELLLTYYQKEVYIISSTTDYIDDPTIITVHTEQHGIWNDTTVWKEALDTMIARHQL